MTTIQEYFAQVAPEYQEATIRIFDILKENLDPTFQAGIIYNMPGFEVPKSVYPSGYHCKPFPPLPFVNVAAQKNFIALYHMGLYAEPELYNWFVAEFPKHSSKKLDMGKSCIRFKKAEDVPFELIAQLAQRMTAQQWINVYEREFLKK
jgi:uncharacterized protein YdhG (YjbR/CyaY superfamily)